MPSPFPGMDPYLEDPILWSSVHQRLITYIGDALNVLLPPHYVANIGERLYVLQPERDIYPGVVVFEQPSTLTPTEQSGGGTAVAEVSDPPLVMTIDPVEVREVFIEILPVRDESRIVTVIEVLSHSNKASGSPGRQLYLTKQREVLQSQTHLIEIDLLRRGAHTVAVPREALLRRQVTWDYLVNLHRGGQGERYEVWAITLRQRLPRICVPLSEGDPDVVLNLQAMFNRCYDEGAYTRRLDYHRANDAAQRRRRAVADALLRERGLRR